MEQIEDIIFLGAGASASEGAPLQGDIFKEYFRDYSHDFYLEDYTINNGMNQRLVDFFETFFGIDINGDLSRVTFPTFEEILGMLELALNREESFKGYSLNHENPQIQKIREDLIFLIAITLDKKLRRGVTGGKYHKTLVNRLKNERKLLKTGFISLNYDILIDNALVALNPEGALRFDFDLDYGVEFTNYETSDDWHRPDPEKAVHLYKLHGSLNWLYCPTCISLTLTPQEKRVAKLVSVTKKEDENYDVCCNVCRSKMIPIVIPPTFFKVMSNVYLQEIWRKAEDTLKQAKRIFFCGYSFPDADIHIKYLLKRVEINRGSTPEIFIVNNHEGKFDHKRKSEKERYRRFFKNRQEIHYTNQSFENFCERGINDG